MIDFKPVEIMDRLWILPFYEQFEIWGSHQNFVNLFAWAKIYNYQWARFEDYLVIKGELPDRGPYYYYPIGRGDLKQVLSVMKEDARNQEHELVFCGLSPQNMDELKGLFPGSFEFKESRDSFDYVYLLENMVTLAGKKLHAKRNYINRFIKRGNWSFEVLSDDNLGECWEMNVEWCKAQGCMDDKNLAKEYCAVHRCFQYYHELGLEGGLLRLEGRVIAFTMGSKLNSNTYNIHIEKAFGEIQGSYQMINREFAAYIQKKHPEIIYLNREEDMGYEGLRKAKLSYNPVRMEEKFIAIYTGD